MKFGSNVKNWFVLNKFLIFIGLLNLLTLFIVIMLNQFSVGSDSWITGWVLGFVSFWIAFFISSKSYEIIIKTDNHFLFYFLFLLKLGVYATPLFIAFLNNNEQVHFAGVFLGLVPLIFTPFINSKMFHF